MFFSLGLLPLVFLFFFLWAFTLWCFVNFGGAFTFGVFFFVSRLEDTCKHYHTTHPTRLFFWKSSAFFQNRKHRYLETQLTQADSNTRNSGLTPGVIATFQHGDHPTVTLGDAEFCGGRCCGFGYLLEGRGGLGGSILFGEDLLLLSFSLFPVDFIFSFF